MPPTHAMAALRTLCQQGLAAAALVPAMLEALHALVPSYRNLFDWTDAQGRLLRYDIEGPIDVALARLYFDEFHNRREAEVMPPFQALRHLPAGVRGADDLDPAGFYRSALYHEIWKPQGFHSRLEAVLRGRQGGLLGSLVLYRAPGDPAFTAADNQRLASLLPLLAQSLEDGMAAGVGGAVAGGAAGPDEPDVPSPDPPETLLLQLDGQLCHASAGAMRLLLMAEGGASRETLSRPLQALGGPLLQPVLARLRTLHDALQRGQQTTLPAAGAVLASHRSGAGCFVATGRLLLPLAGAPQQSGLGSGRTNTPLVQLSLQRHEPQRVALERALRSLPITPGQVAVCRALYQGQPQAAIGQALGVAPSTVVDHVRKAYRALDLHSVLELRALLDGCMQRATPQAAGCRLS